MKLMQYLRDMKIFQKFFISYLLVAVIPFFFLNIIFYNDINKKTLDQAQSYFKYTFESVLQAYQSKFTQLEDALNLVVNNKIVQDVVFAEGLDGFEMYSYVVLQLDPIIAALQLYNPLIKDINIYTPGDINKSRISYKDLSDFNDIKLKDKIVDQVEGVWKCKDNELKVFQKIYCYNQLDKYAIIELTIDDEEMLLTDLALETDMFNICIKNGNNEIIYENINSQFKDKIFREQVITPSNFSLYMEINTGKYLVSDEKIFASLIKRTILSLVFIILITTIFTSNFTKRITKLKDKLSIVVSSNFDIDFSSNDRDEIGEINNCIDGMIKKTKLLIDEVYASEIHQREAEIKALQAQINPHFLYNTLSAINWKALQNEDYEMSDLVTSMSIFYRTVLNKGENITTVKNELKNVQAYIKIQQLVLDYTFDVIYDIDSKVYEYNMPNLILQPIVENAIEHGIKLKKEGRGLIKISAYQNNEDIIFEIFDNGNGIEEEMINEILVKDTSKGYGIKNVNDRLKLFFDQTYGVEYKSEKEKGTIAFVKVPKYIHI